MAPVSDLDLLIETLSPELHAGTYVFAMLGVGERVDLHEVVSLMREPEGVSVIVEEEVATRLGLQPVLRCAWITLNVNSDLQAVGLTAEFSAALGRAGVSCNVVAGTHHDHIFVPVAQADMAMRALRALQAARGRSRKE
jgi:uncharacterized protein